MASKCGSFQDEYAETAVLQLEYTLFQFAGAGVFCFVGLWTHILYTIICQNSISLLQSLCFPSSELWFSPCLLYGEFLVIKIIHGP